MTKGEVRWRERAQRYADRVGVAGRDLWDSDDPYDLFEAAHAAFEAGRKPRDFINGIFAEDMASREYDNLLAAEATESMEGEIEDE